MDFFVEGSVKKRFSGNWQRSTDTVIYHQLYLSSWTQKCLWSKISIYGGEYWWDLTCRHVFLPVLDPFVSGYSLQHWLHHPLYRRDVTWGLFSNLTLSTSSPVQMFIICYNFHFIYTVNILIMRQTYLDTFNC